VSTGHLVVNHPDGPVGLEWCDGPQGAWLVAVHLDAARAATSVAGVALPDWLRRLSDDLQAGRQPAWALAHCRLDDLGAFARKVLVCLHREVGPGEVLSYGELAQRCGSPGAARAVGGALAANPYPLIIPCHRVVAADGRLGGFMGDPADRSGWKARLLAREGRRCASGRWR
jgi:methylated-DNA-[protein]-cysteine S-methyltransferase